MSNLQVFVQIYTSRLFFKIQFKVSGYNFSCTDYSDEYKFSDSSISVICYEFGFMKVVLVENWVPYVIDVALSTLKMICIQQALSFKASECNHSS